MKRILLICLSLQMYFWGFTQPFQTIQGTISFTGKLKNYRDIEATSNKVAALYIPYANTLNFKVPISSFVFTNSAIREQFNVMMRSDNNPDATFKGSLENGKVDINKAGTYNVTAAGLFKMNGKEKSVSIPGTVQVTSNATIFNAKFTVLLADYDIIFPAVYGELKQIEITLNCKLDAKSK